MNTTPAELEDKKDESPSTLFAPVDILVKAKSENFAVASRLLPRAERDHLLAIYGFARFVDDIGDRASGDRVSHLDWAEAELDRALESKASNPIFVAIGKTAQEISCGRKPFIDLIAANRQDQIVTRYKTYEELEAYCDLSANPVGRLVLATFGRSDPDVVLLSDRICTGLQLVEHWQDVSEDYANGRIYLPIEDLQRFGVDEEDLGRQKATKSLRRLMAFECTRARTSIESGMGLIRMLPGRAGFAVAGFAAGGLAQLDAIADCEFDVLARNIKATKAAIALRTLSLFARSRQRR